MTWSRTEILGRVLGEPDFRYTTNGTALLKLFVGCGTQKKPCAIEVLVWGELAEQNQHTKKGEDVAIIGRLQQDSWQSMDGVKKTKHLISATQISSETRFSHEAREAMARKHEREHGSVPQDQGRPPVDENVPF